MTAVEYQRLKFSLALESSHVEPVLLAIALASSPSRVGHAYAWASRRGYINRVPVPVPCK